VRVLVACFGNPLRGDDGCGVAVAAALSAGSVPAGVEVREVGIGGIHLVQDLFVPTDALVVVDAVDLQRRPGTVVVLRPDVRDLDGLSPQARRDELADVHYATPARALMLARAMAVLPDETLLVGVQVAEPDGLGEGLAPPVARAVAVAATEVRRVVTGLGVPWPDEPAARPAPARPGSNGAGHG
jgi:hydrogenase maturation protease